MTKKRRGSKRKSRIGEKEMLIQSPKKKPWERKHQKQGSSKHMDRVALSTTCKKGCRDGGRRLELGLFVRDLGTLNKKE